MRRTLRDAVASYGRSKVPRSLAQAVLCTLKGRQREIFEETGLTAEIGADRFFPTVRAALAAFEWSAPDEGR